MNRINAVTELVESLCKASAESNLFELCRAAAKDIQVPSIDYAESQKKYSSARIIAEPLNRIIIIKRLNDLTLRSNNRQYL